MKLKRLAALTLTLALTLSLTVIPTHALQFTDVTEDFWGYEDITKMSNRGYAKGYDDGTFKPNGRMTAAETLLFCARATGVDATTQAKIAEDRKEQMTETLPTANNMNVWAAGEMAVALEAGVLSISELEALSAVDPKTKDSANGEKTFLEQTMPRENICMYLVRAMQLEPLARSLSNYSLSYTDRDDISSALQPYVYVLTQYGIVKGKDGGNFDPKGPVTRAEMTTMLSRALDFMTENGITTELSEYTTYAWKAGTISNVTTAADGSTILALTSELSGTQSFSIPATAKIYNDNMLSSSTALRVGQYARLNLSDKGAIREIRVSGVLTSYTGTISDLTDGKLSLLINGISHTLTIDRFTEVAVGKDVGDRSLIDEDAGYTSAVCYVDEMGHLAAVRFSGGTQLAEGLVESVTALGDTTTLGVTAFNGVVYHYPIPSGITVTVNGSLGSLSSSHVGKYVQIRLVTDSNQIASVAVDTTSSFVQGPIKRLGTIGTARSVHITDIFTGKEVVPTVSQSAVITYDGESRTAAEIESGWYVTAMLTGNMIVQMDAFPGSTMVEGTLTSINYGNPSNPAITIQVTQEDGISMNYALDINNPPSINRDGKRSSIEQLRTGDRLEMTIRYNNLEQIDATPQTANLTGIIERVTQERSGVVIDVVLSDGSSTSYTVTEGVSVTQNGNSSNIHNLKPGFAIGLVTNGNQVISIEITSVASSATELEGSILSTNTSGVIRTMTVLITDALGNTSPVVIDARNARMMNMEGKDLNLATGFVSGDRIEAKGSYDGATFVATIIIKQ